MSNRNVRSALLLATASFVSMPGYSQLAPGTKVGARMNSGIAPGQRIMKRRAFDPRTGMVGQRIMKPGKRIKPGQTDKLGKRAIKLRKHQGSTGIRAQKLKPMERRIKPIVK